MDQSEIKMNENETKWVNYTILHTKVVLYSSKKTFKGVRSSEYGGQDLHPLRLIQLWRNLSLNNFAIVTALL